MLTQGCEHCQGLGEKVEPKCRHRQKLNLKQALLRWNEVNSNDYKKAKKNKPKPRLIDEQTRNTKDKEKWCMRQRFGNGEAQ